MGASLVTRPTSEPLTLAEARAHLRIETTELDAVIAAELMAAREYVEGQTRRALAPQTWDFTFDFGWPMVGCEYRIDLPLAPVVSVTSVTYVDDAGATQTLAANQYQVAGLGPDGLPRIVPAYNVTWPAVRCQREAITVRCVCGYEVGSPARVMIPEALRQAIKLQLELLHDRDTTARETIEMARDSLMTPYRIVRL